MLQLLKFYSYTRKKVFSTPSRQHGSSASFLDLGVRDLHGEPSQFNRQSLPLQFCFPFLNHILSVYIVYAVSLVRSSYRMCAFNSPKSSRLPQTAVDPALFSVYTCQSLSHASVGSTDSLSQLFWSIDGAQTPQLPHILENVCLIFTSRWLMPILSEACVFCPFISNAAILHT